MLAALVLGGAFLLAPAPRRTARTSFARSRSRSTCATRTRSASHAGAGEWLHLERQDRDRCVAPLELPAYEGDVGGVLPIVAAQELEALKQRFPDLEPVEEGKARINQVAGYSLAFRAGRKPRLYGRLVLLPQPARGRAPA